ncbi:hypothetical protein [Paenibacillus sp. IHB B 3415]|uniref:hypothetical protein n=1 Tax=Paenibacillus sp. IHB B 3415 TaxID=867080 RepID=UPI001F32FC87|nr:hypothetical protein [Paenibacillus sp. IHB B 3415]
MSVSLDTFFLSFTYGGVTTFLPFFAESIQVNSATFFLAYAIALTVTRPIAGKLADRYSGGTIIIPSLIISSVALLILSISGGLTGVILAAVFMELDSEPRNRFFKPLQLVSFLPIKKESRMLLTLLHLI